MLPKWRHAQCPIGILYIWHISDRNLSAFCAQERTPQGKKATLSTYDVKAGSTIRVMVLLCEVPDDVEDAVFDLYWGYPNSGQDFLDASALFYSGKTRVAIFDFRRRSNDSFPAESVTHSGDMMDNATQTGHHLITVRLHHLPPTITSIFFVLSAWNSPTISFFKRPSLNFFDKSKPDKQLCENHVKDLPAVQAVIMCRVDKTPSGSWTVYDMGTRSQGNAMNYTPIEQTLQTSL